MTSVRPLGRLAPSDWRHVERYPFAAASPAAVERTLTLPRWRVGRYPHDQGQEGSCVGHAVAIERAISNRRESSTAVRYDPITLWREAKRIDEWPTTQPGDNNGTSVRAAYEVTRTQGLSPVKAMELVGGFPRAVEARPFELSAGVDTYRWARTVDEVRAAIAAGLPVAIGVNWYAGLDVPVRRSGAYWLPTPTPDVRALGRLRGGHSVCLYGASDRRQAFRMVNSWGASYPLVWLPYSLMEFLLGQDGEAALVTDRAGS